MIVMGLSVLATGKADYVGKSGATELSGRMAQHGRGLHLVVRSGVVAHKIRMDAGWSPKHSKFVGLREDKEAREVVRES